MPFQVRSLREYAFPKPLLISTRLCGITSRKIVFSYVSTVDLPAEV